MPQLLDLPAEIVVLGLRIILIVALYVFLFIVIREIHRDWRRAARSSAATLGLVVSSSESPRIQVGHRFELGRMNTIGRLPGSTIRLDDEHISGRHAELNRDGDGAWLLRDSGSTNGTRLNGLPVNGSVQVHVGDVIELGTVTLRMQAFEP